MAVDAQSLLRLHSAARGLSKDEIREIASSTDVRKHQLGDAVIEPGAVPQSTGKTGSEVGLVCCRKCRNRLSCQTEESSHRMKWGLSA
jgi:hypothetical protein